MSELPLLPTTVIGSAPMPSWLVVAKEQIREGRFGEDDIRETLDDAVRVALLDQEEAGIDILGEGELRRDGYLSGVFRLTGLRRLEQRKKIGAVSYDRQARMEAVEPIGAPEGLGVAEEFAFVRAHTRKPLKATCPGPITLTQRIQPGKVYKDRLDVAWALVPLVNAELRKLVAAGATFIQIDEPSYAGYPTTHEQAEVEQAVEVFNATVEGVKAKIGLHICFGNNEGRPSRRRSYRSLFPAVLQVRAEQIALEFASREMAEAELFRGFGDKELGAGIIDQKSFYVERPEEVADRVRALLRHGPREKLYLNPDCGFYPTPRHVALAKMRALVEGVRRVREG
ncbi:MAG: methionine synthase [Deltaproteobacteria bacterium]|nr:methionine synthase [Deltaproteobacteria bacterium]